MNKIILLILGLFLLLPLVSAVEIVDFYWINSQNDNLEISYGESAQFEAYISDGFSDFSVDIFLEEDSTGLEIPIFNRRYNARDVAEIIMSITRNYYLGSGSYTLHINALNDNQDRVSDELYLTINQPQNQAPTIELVYPRNGDQNIPINPILSWEASDEDNDALTYDVYLNSNLIADNINVMQHQLQNLNYNANYNWYVVASDGVNAPVRSQTWNFRTTEQPRPENHAPTIQLLYPGNRAQNIPTEVILRWQGFDEDNDQITYDVYLNGILKLSNTRLNSLFLEDLRYDGMYRWYVVASDGELETRSNTWNFRTTTLAEEENQVPTINIINPTENEVLRGNYNIVWDANDNDGNVINTKIYYKPYSRIPLLKYLINMLNEYTLLADLEGNPESYIWNTNNFRNGIYSLKIIVTDDDNAQGEDIIGRIRIINIRREINNAPEIISQPVTRVMVNKYYNYDVDAIDHDNDRITYRLINAPRGMSLNSDSGLIIWLARDVGQFLVTVRATDEHGAYDSQTFIVNVLQEEISLVKSHEFSISNVILNYDNQYINVYVKLDNDGSYNERIQLRAVNMNTGEVTYDSFLLENGDGYWRILKLPKPRSNGIYTIGVLGNSKDYKDILYREIAV